VVRQVRTGRLRGDHGTKRGCNEGCGPALLAAEASQDCRVTVLTNALIGLLGVAGVLAFVAAVFTSFQGSDLRQAAIGVAAGIGLLGVAQMLRLLAEINRKV
jgi:hypothetical protein